MKLWKLSIIPSNFLQKKWSLSFRLKAQPHFTEGVYKPTDDPVDPTEGVRNIQTGQDWYVLIHWDQIGRLIHCMAGTWYVQVYFEKMGAGEVNLMPSPREVKFKNENPGHYLVDVPFYHTSVNVKPGLYKVAVSLTFRGPAGEAVPIAAVAEGPVIQFYDGWPLLRWVISLIDRTLSLTIPSLNQ